VPTGISTLRVAATGLSDWNTSYTAASASASVGAESIHQPAE
jgi:hypothetical protein